MSQFPVTTSQGIKEASNYLLSGPSGLGQYFGGYSTSQFSTLTGNFRAPFASNTITLLCTGVTGTSELTVPSTTGLAIGQAVFGIGLYANTTIIAIIGLTVILNNVLLGNINNYIDFTNNALLFVNPIPLGTCYMIDGYTTRFNFVSAQSLPPFQLGNPVTIDGVTDSFYNGTYSPIGVVECTTTYVTLKTQTLYAIEAPSSGGTASFSNTNTTDTSDQFISTDCNSKVVVNGATDRVFLSAFIIASWIGTGSGITNKMVVTTAINRYSGFLTTDPTNPDYRFVFDKTVISQREEYFSAIPDYAYDVTISFSSVIDTPPPGYYFYILETSFNLLDGDLQLQNYLLFDRSLTTQVVKQ
jgi:hypothetical protein